MQARVLNNSPTENIYVVFKSSEDAILPEPSQSPISPKTTAKRVVNSATMNLFIWTNPSSPPIWQGVVPTFINKEIIISPEKKEVSYDGVILPSGFSPTTDPRELGGKPADGPIGLQWLVLVLIIVMIMIIIYFFWWKK